MNGFEQRLLECPSLPRLPVGARLLTELITLGEVDTAALVEVLEEDGELGGLVLGLLSARQSGVQLSSLAEAATVTGSASLSSTALAASLTRGLRESIGVTEMTDALWRSALMTALATRALAFEASSWDPGEAFLVGLLEKLGALLLYDQLPEYPRLAARFLSGDADLLELERQQLESDHGRIGVLALEKWGLAERLLAPLRAHFAIDRASAREADMTRGRILTAGAFYARSLAVEGFARETLSLERRIADLVRIPQTLAQRIAVELPWELRRTAAVLGIDCSRQSSYDELLEEARELEADPTARPVTALSAVTTPARSSSREWEDLIRDGQKALSTDPDTNHFDLVGFERILRAFFQRAAQLGRPLSLMLISVNDLKEIASSHGQRAAREVMQGLGERVVSLVRATDPKGDLSDVHLGVLAAGCSERDLPRLAERIRLAITHAPLPTCAGPVDCSVSIGMASASPDAASADPQALMSSAWSALDEAALCGGPVAIGV
ncbi:MAG: HDOD domain-containing protein [Deltaproteobacteria bacterium]|nr:HDOD domain-containing protein [Deltaproteobacteria bacterium]MBW2414206.1 HDOD domain-containing protein [Deltaproteobacteria bacterium]